MAKLWSMHQIWTKSGTLESEFKGTLYQVLYQENVPISFQPHLDRMVASLEMQARYDNLMLQNYEMFWASKHLSAANKESASHMLCPPFHGPWPAVACHGTLMVWGHCDCDGGSCLMALKLQSSFKAFPTVLEADMEIDPGPRFDENPLWPTWWQCFRETDAARPTSPITSCKIEQKHRDRNLGMILHFAAPSKTCRRFRQSSLSVHYLPSSWLIYLPVKAVVLADISIPYTLTSRWPSRWESVMDWTEKEITGKKHHTSRY